MADLFIPQTFSAKPNGRVERAFSVMKVVKTDCRNCLGEDHLDDLMHIPYSGKVWRAECLANLLFSNVHW